MPGGETAGSTPSSGSCGDDATYTFEDGCLIISGTGAIADSAFAYNEDIVTVVIGEGITSIGEFAFQGCTDLESVDIPDSVTSIGSVAFGGCTGLESVDIPASVTSIGNAVFQGCTGLTTISVDADNECYSSSEDGVLFDKEKTELIAYPAGKSGSYAIPASVTSIGVVAFQGCTGLTSVVIPDGVTSIGAYAFDACASLTIVYYGGSEAAWTAIEIGNGNDSLTGATICYDTVIVDIATCTVTVEDAVYTGKALTPVVIVKYGDRTLAQGTDYTVAYSDNVNVGTGKVTVTGAGGCTGTVEVSFTITTTLVSPAVSSVKNAAEGVAVKWCKVDGASGYRVYRDGKLVGTIMSGSTVKWVDATAKNGRTYEYTVAACSGSAVSAVSAAKKICRLSAPKIKSVKSKVAKKAVVKWKKNAKSGGYQIRYSTSKSFSRAKTKTVITVKGKKKVKKVISGLKSGKKYYFQVRFYKKTSGTTYYSAWSAKKSVKVSK